MALADRRWQRTSTLCALYFAQGVPWGFMTIALISYLTSRGVADAEAGALAAIVLVPWSFKLIWGPIIDSVTIRSMGRRRAWIIGAELMMAITLLGFLAMGDVTENLKLVGAMFFLHNCFASLQDVATDALAIDILPIEEQASANGLMWGSKLVGKGLGGAAMAWVMSEWGLPAAVLLQFVLLLVIMIFPLLFLEREGEKRFPWSKGQAVKAGSVASVRSPIQVLKDLFMSFSLRTTLVFAVFGVIKLVGSGVNEIITKTLYLQQLGWDFVEFTKVLALYGVFTTLGGALLGGFVANRVGRRTIITFGFGGFGVVTIIFALGTSLWNDDWFTTSYLLATEGLLAIGSVGFLSMSMRITWTKASATMFTTYMTLSNIGHVIGNSLAGPVREHLSYQQTFLFIGITSFIPLALLLLVEPMQVDLAKRAEADALS